MDLGGAEVREERGGREIRMMTVLFSAKGGEGGSAKDGMTGTE